MTRRQKRKKQLRHQQLKSAAFAAATVASLTFTSPQAIKAEELKTTAKNPEVESKSVVENPLESAQTMEFVEEGAAPAISEAPSQETPVVASETSSTEDSKPATSVTYTVEYRDQSGQLVHQVIKTAIIAEGQDSVTVTENAIELVNDEALANYYDETGESLTRTATITRGGTATISYTVSSFEDPSKETVSTPQRDVTVNYDVIYTEAGLEVYRETRSHTFKTYDTVGSTSIVVSPDLTATELQGYSLAAGSSATQVLNLMEGQSHQVTFEVKGASKGRDTRKVDYSNGDTNPYLTIENYTEGQKGNDNVTLKTNGNTVDFVYKIGFTRIAADDLELTEDAQKLGLTLDTTEGYIRGSVVIDVSKLGRYEIGFQSKTNPTVKVAAIVTINPHVGFTLENPLSGPPYSWWQNPRPFENFENYFRIDNANAIGESWEEIANTDQWPSRVTHEVDGVTTPYHYLGYQIKMLTTPFGYVVGSNETVANATKDTEQYLNVIPISARDTQTEFNGNLLGLTIADFEVLETSPGVEVKLLDVRTQDLTGTSLHWKDATQFNYSYSTLTRYNSDNSVEGTPYFLQFTNLPAQKADNLYVKFRIVDNLGLEKFFKVDFSTFERSLSGAISNADVKFTGSSTYLNESNNTVQIPISNDEQVLGTVVLNKENAWVKSVSLPIGTKLVATKTDSEGRALEANVVKEAGIKLNPGKYTFEVKAVDGHFGDNAPNRVFNFEVTDAINPIPHQVWTEGTKPDAIPVSMEMGSTIADIRIENGGDYAYLEGNSTDSTISIYGLKRTPSNQTARVYVKYLNGDGTTTETFTDFTYEVSPAPDNDLQVSVTNDAQTVVEGGTWLDMVITHTEGAILKVDTSKLPKGTRYNAATKTISGIGRYEGTYDVPIIVEKDGVVKGTFVHLVVTPGTFEVPDEAIEVTVLDKNTVLGFKDLPDGSKVTYTSYSYEIERGDTGFVVSDDKTKITGVPTRVGSYYLNATISKVASNGLVRTDTATLTIKVKGIKPSLEVTNAEQTVDILTAMSQGIQDIHITKDAYSNLGGLDSWRFPPGVTYDQETGILSGKPTRVGTYNIDVTTEMPWDYSADLSYDERLVRKTITIKVTGIKPTLDISNADQTLDVGTAIQNIQITKDDYSNLTVDTNSLPSGVSYNPSTGIISGTPNQVGNYRIRVYTQMPDDYSSDLNWSDRYIEKYITLNVTPLHPSLTVSSEEQTFSSVTDMTPVTLENDARSTINVSNLPDGVRYDEGTKTISGRPTNGVGDYTITVTASMPYALGGEVVTKTVKLHVTAVAPSIDATNDHQTVTAKDAITTIQVSKDAYSTMAEPYVLLNDGRQVSLSEIGLHYDNDAKTITGTPTVVGTHTIKLSTELERKLGGGTANKDVTLVVNEIPMSLDIANQEQTKIVMSAIDPVILTVPADTTITVDEGSLPPGVRYNADTKTFEGTPTRIGTYNVTVTVAPTGVRNNDLTKTVTFHVTALPASIDISNNNQTIQLGTEMTASVVTPNQYGELRGLDAILESVGNNSSGITERMIAQYLLGQYGLVYDTNTHTISGTPTKTGQIRFTFKSVNSFELGSNTAEETFVLTIVNDQSRIPVITAAVEGTTTITGTGVDGATITVTLPDGTEKTAQVVDGVWSVTSDKPLVKGQNISARQQENHKSVSDNISGSVAVADSLSPSALPVVNPVIEGTTTITGTGVDGATITVTLPDGSVK
ncbi:hypothetical protein HCC45_02305, partial [Streptococcus suis]|nr:hypothetical protein [Streptococcus suis]